LIAHAEADHAVWVDCRTGQYHNVVRPGGHLIGSGKGLNAECVGGTAALLSAKGSYPLRAERSTEHFSIPVQPNRY
jgi:hypothetical protein